MKDNVISFMPVERKQPSSKSSDNDKSMNMSAEAAKVSGADNLPLAPAMPEKTKQLPQNTPAAPVVAKTEETPKAAEAKPAKVPEPPVKSAVPQTKSAEVIEKGEVVVATEQQKPLEPPKTEKASENIDSSVRPAESLPAKTTEIANNEATPESSATAGVATMAGVPVDNGSDGVAEDVTDGVTEEIVEVERDGRAELAVVHTFVKDRLQGQIEFKGKGRKLIFIPPAPNFQLSGNTLVNLSFKIDKNGNTYDIDIPPVSRDVERLLRDFVNRMRFSAVLYDESDLAGMKVNLRVR